ncbi:hypothetical protein VTK26DRAFT_5317 [Humicola hyalothermophila]
MGSDAGRSGRVVMAEIPLVIPPSVEQQTRETPQKIIDEYWKKFTTKAPGKAMSVLPKNELTERLVKRAAAAKDLAVSAATTTGESSSKTVTASYEQAAALCRAKVDKIVAECRRVNQKYTDPHFDLDYDLWSGQRDCLESLSNDRADYPDSDLESCASAAYSSASSTCYSSSGESGRRPRRRAERRKGKRRGRYRQHGEGGHGGDRAAAATGGSVGGGRGGGKMAGLIRDADAAAGGGRSNNGDNKRAGGNGAGPRWPGYQFTPKSVKRVGEIFDDPKFYIDGPTANDVRQGRDGDCWLLAALCTLSNKPGLIERVCVAHNQDVGVYGFVFHRDGEWFSEIIDDKLYLIKPDYDHAHAGRHINVERMLWEDIDRPDSEEIYRRTYQSNSGALYFAQCENPNETWLPLLEKAYAKAHGDYAAIEGGFFGEGIEDLTGGVTTELFTADILDKEYFWKEELMKVNKDFLFGCSTGLWGLGFGERKGIQEQHAYSVMRAVEIDGQRLLLLKNPWGSGEWKGPWSDGSKEWTPEWLKKLNHQFGDDGAFWISYKDLLRKFQTFDRTRLFGPEWKMASIWTTLNVPWSVEYHHTKFSFTLAKPGPVVIVLSQLDDRYFRGLEGPYVFGLGFRLHRTGEEDYLVRAQTSYRTSRSCNVELTLEAGEYTVLVKVDATRFDGLLPPEDVVRLNAKKRREKLLRIGLAHDLAHSKARTVETPEEKAAREAYEKRQQDKHRKVIRNLFMGQKRKNHYFRAKERARRKELEKKRAEKKEAKRAAAREKALRRQAERQEEEASKEETAIKEEPEQPGEGGQAPEKADAQAEGTDHREGEPAEGEPSAEPTVAAEDVPPTDSKPSETKIEVETPGTEDSAQPGANTPPASTSETSGPEAVEEKGSATSEKEDENKTVIDPAGKGASDATVKQDDSAEAVLQSPPGAVPKEGQDAVGTGSVLGHRDTSKPLEPEVQEKIRKAINAISEFKNELEGLLGGAAGVKDHDGQDGDAEDGDNQREDDHGRPHMQPRRPPPHHPHYHHHPFAGPRQPPHGPPDRRRMLPPNPPAHARLGPPPIEQNDREFPDRNPRAPSPPPSFAPPSSSDEDDEILSSLSEISDTELDYLVKQNDRQVASLLAQQAQCGGGGGGGHQHSYPRQQQRRPGRPMMMGMDEFERNPWNAVAVVGLRVYYKAGEGEEEKKKAGEEEEELVKLRVVRPSKYEWSEDEDEDEEGKGDGKGAGGEKGKEGGEGEGGVEEKEEGEGMDESKVLDVDDSAKDAVIKGEGKHNV